MGKSTMMLNGVAACLVLNVLLIGCASMQHPQLYPNAHLQQVGQQQAEQDIEACRELASAHVQSTAGEDVAKDTAIGAAGGTAAGAVGGAISGNVGLGAAVGAATGATAGFLSGLFKETPPSPVYKEFVDRCLRERGYEVVGWE
jgi:hypothetical protein